LTLHPLKHALWRQSKMCTRIHNSLHPLNPSLRKVVSSLNRGNQSLQTIPGRDPVMTLIPGHNLDLKEVISLWSSPCGLPLLTISAQYDPVLAFKALLGLSPLGNIELYSPVHSADSALPKTWRRQLTLTSSLHPSQLRVRSC
jgi:hypothetical protein